jgi:hypothetical protein
VEEADPATFRATCSGCGYKLWDRRKGEWTLVARVLRLTAARELEAKCPECRADVPIGFLQIRPPDSIPAPAGGAPGVRTGTRLVIRVDSIPRS